MSRQPCLENVIAKFFFTRHGDQNGRSLERCLPAAPFLKHPQYTADFSRACHTSDAGRQKHNTTFCHNVTMCHKHATLC